MPLKPHPTDPDKMVFVGHHYDITDWKAKYDALLTEYEAQANRAITNNDFKERLAQAIEQMPFGKDTTQSFAIFVRDFK